MKQIAITKGHLVVVDDEDFDYLSKFTWHYSTGYAARRSHKSEGGKSRILLMHRQILGEPVTHVDHINGNRLDNRRSNIRLATAQDNMRNKSKSKNTSSQYKGVSYNKNARKWQSYIMVDYKRIHLGLHEREEDAATTYNLSAHMRFGEFAKLNEAA